MKTIFEPFVQSQSGLGSQEGTGLGLPISRKFAQLMGGDITLENTPSPAATPATNNGANEQMQGMVARVHIQAHKVLGTNIKATRTERSVMALAAGQPRYKILVVDDKAPNRQLLVKLLGPIGFELKEASNGQVAIDITAQWQPDLILMDLRMPVLNGFEASRAIKQATGSNQPTHSRPELSQPRENSPKIIALSASNYQIEQQNAIAAGCDEFIRKPFKTAELFDAIAEHLNAHYDYALPTETLIPKERNNNTQPLDKTALNALPTPLLEQLEWATLRLHWDDIFHTIEHIRSQDDSLANDLTHAVNQFKYGQILEAIHTAKPSS
ncbi:MAG: response regulator [Cyanobacteria bacterium J06598_3]